MKKIICFSIILSCFSCVYLRKKYYSQPEINKAAIKWDIPLEHSYFLSKSSLERTFPNDNISYDMIGLKLFDQQLNQREVSGEKCSVGQIRKTNIFDDLRVLETNQLSKYISLYPKIKDRMENYNGYTLLVLWSVRAGKTVTNDFLDLAKRTNGSNNAQILYLNTDIDREYLIY